MNLIAAAHMGPGGLPGWFGIGAVAVMAAFIYLGKRRK